MCVRPRCFKRLVCAIFGVLLFTYVFQSYLLDPYWMSASNEKLDKFWGFSDPMNFLSLNGSEDSRYKIWSGVWTNRDPRVDTISVGVATQCSLDNMKDVLVLAGHWAGPISLAVFVEGGDFPLFKRKLNYLVRCFSDVADRVSVHVVIPISRPPPKMQLDVQGWSDPSICSTFLEPPVFRSNYDNSRVPYPVNLLRNTAVKNLHSKHVLVLDVDMIPSASLLSEVTKSHIVDAELNALVIPAFEIRTRNFLPSSKVDLIRMWRDTNVRPFYKEVCWKCQKYTLYDKWEASEHPYLVEWQDPWEPFYVARRDMVTYDERFEQYGFNRISQLCDMHMLGIKFYVSQSAFLLHVGFKFKSSFHKNKDIENERNKLIYRKVKAELFERHRNSGRRC